MPSDKLPPLSQSYYDDNRERFGAETAQIESTIPACKHFVARKSATEVSCSRCHMTWIDMGRFVIKDGEIVSVS